jgi:myotubularin-related protein 6/7/8
VEGTLHLTPHHLIFCYTPARLLEDKKGDAVPAKPRELWITYPIIQICTLRPAPAASRLPSSIRLRCRDFTFVCFCFTDERKARDVYDSIKAWTCKLGRIEKLYAFNYQPQKPEKDVDGWAIYDARAEWRRLGIGGKCADKGWRISTINVDYAVREVLCRRTKSRLINPSSLPRTLLYCQYQRPSLTTPSTMLVGIARECGYLY